MCHDENKVKSKSICQQYTDVSCPKIKHGMEMPMTQHEGSANDWHKLHPFHSQTCMAGVYAEGKLNMWNKCLDAPIWMNSIGWLHAVTHICVQWSVQINSMKHDQHRVWDKNPCRQGVATMPYKSQNKPKNAYKSRKVAQA